MKSYQQQMKEPTFPDEFVDCIVTSAVPFLFVNMTKPTKTTKKLTGEDPVDMFGGDAENIVEELAEHNSMENKEHISIITLQIVKLIQRFHPAEQCPHEGNCLSEKEMLQELEEIIKQIHIKEREIIKSNLMSVADKGEYEDMRREIENYFATKI